MVWLVFGSFFTLVLIWKRCRSERAADEERRQRRRVEGPPPRGEDEEQEQEQDEEQEQEQEEEQEEEQQEQEQEQEQEEEEQEPGSPLIEDRIQLSMPFSRLTLDTLQLQYGPTDRVMRCIVIPERFSATFTVTCLLREKLKHRNWTLAEHHRRGNVIVKFFSADDPRPLHGKWYEWNKEKVSFWNVASIRPEIPDPQDVRGVKRI
jgi:hypothetical protein